jgi:hypothetical protein
MRAPARGTDRALPRTDPARARAPARGTDLALTRTVAALLTPPIAVVRHLPAMNPTEVRALTSSTLATFVSLRSIELHADVELHVDEPLFSSKQQVDVHLKAHVASVCFKCFSCFRGMLQVFHMDVAKVDRDVAYVAMVVHVCCKLLSPMYYQFFQTYVASMFIWMLHMFDIYFQMFLSGCYVCFCNRVFLQMF